ncbi:Topoisomerase 1-associated factor 1 [Entomortierella chlamydospora]|uniref:Topoisomerase 1-associated factor 1 n=1 Tax=Entomortierella chlamydospora TaxID=101097 RepID=A0A9P6N364_9FUNG|nr:Topoisomerase 1-associated factor 1 [Entomortierella chlamydospora]
MDPDTESLLVSTCLALGGYEDISEDMNDDRQVYVMGDECLGCLKDIKKFIKYYDEPGDNVALTFLGKLGILEKDLIPIMLLNSPPNNPVKERLVLACIEVIVPMTWIIDYKELQKLAVMEEDHSVVGNLHQRLEILRGYKRAFLKPGVLRTVFDVLLRPLEVEHRMRTTRDQAIIRLGLSLFRNLVAIPDTESPVSGTMDQFISSIMQEELLARFQDENIMALLITLASSASEPQLSEFNAMTLEIFYYIFTGIDADDLIPSVTDGTRLVLHKKGALFSSFETHLDSIKKPRAPVRRKKEADDYKKTVTKSGLGILRGLALTLLESCFNPLFGSMRGDIEMEREKIKGYHRSQYHCLMAFLLRFQRLYLDYVNRECNEQKKNATPEQQLLLEEEYRKNVLQCDFDLVAKALEVVSVYQVIGYMHRLNEEPYNGRVMTLHIMFKSPNETYRDASDIVQNNLYYQEATLEVFLELAKRYKLQSKLMIHILLKTLETYSNSKSYMSTLKRKRIIAKKRKEANAKSKDGQETTEERTADQNGIENGDGNQAQGEEQEQRQGDEDEEREDESALTMKEHQFVFKDYERRFATERIIDTYCVFLENFEDLDEAQLHWAASLFHRVAVNAGNIAIFYKLSTLHLFHRILQSGREETKRDMVPFVSYVIHQFFKKMQEYPLLVVEVLFPRSSKACLDINVGREEAEKELRIQETKKEKRMMATELEIDPNRSEEDQIKIVVTAFIYDDQTELVEWAVEILKGAVISRQLMTLRSEEELAENPDLMHSVENVEDIPVVADNPARNRGIRLVPRLRLLFKLLHFTREDHEMKFKIPKEIPTDTLSDYQDMIETILKEDPEHFSQYDYSQLIVTKKKPKRTDQRREGGGGRRKKEELKETHTAEYVIDSEDDDDDAYFESEKGLRERTHIDFTRAEERHRKMVIENEKNKSRTQKDMLVKKFGPQSVATEDEQDDTVQQNIKKPPLPKVVSDLDSDSEEEETRKPPPKSTSDVESDDDDSDDISLSRPTPRQQYSSQRKTVRLDDSSDDENNDGATQPLSFTQRMAQAGNKRRIILADSDEDEDAYDSDNQNGSQESNSGPAKKKFAF